MLEIGDGSVPPPPYHRRIKSINYEYDYKAIGGREDLPATFEWFENKERTPVGQKH